MEVRQEELEEVLTGEVSDEILQKSGERNGANYSNAGTSDPYYCGC